ncbi:O-methyltransferase ZRP4 [Iris pallida]|uniref:O-methyltransferase ZRP4 n=1 Tax=Iris pallida TaxID=29817 RepID=A0AAX6HLB9_IRIPA|nr:O-methyltransferase ZRP4 [Iris pallida]
MPSSTNGDEAVGDLHSAAQLANTIMQFMKPMALKCAVELGVPEAIHKHGRPMSVPLLAAELSLPPSKASCLARVMRTLEHSGFFAKTSAEEVTYALTPLSRYLVEGGSDLVRGVLQPAMVTPSFRLGAWFRSDVPTAFHIDHGMSIYEYTGKNPEFNRLFNKGNANNSELVMREVVQKCGDAFEGVATLVDAGGGNGFVSRALAAAFPHLRCTVLDLPHVASQTPSERVEFVQGDMFEHIPPADAVLLKCVMHNYDEEGCLKLLKRCKEAINPSEGRRRGRLIVIDIVIDAFVDGCYSESLETRLFMDMQMMTVLGAQEREEKEWKNIFVQAGFSSYKITPLSHDSLSLIEVYP